MKCFCFAIFSFFALFIPATTYGSDIQGRIQTAQGTGSSGATVIVRAEGNSQTWKATANSNGDYSISDIKPGFYTVTVTSAAAGVTLRRDVSIKEPTEKVRLDFQLPSAADASSSGEEYNPNIFVFKIDQNQVRNKLQTARGPDPQYIANQTADRNFFGAEYGTPVFTFDPIRPRSLAASWRGTAIGFVQNSVLNARNFFNVGPLLPSRSSSFGITAGGPVISPDVSMLFQFGRSFNSGMVNGNVQEPLGNERTPLNPDPHVAAIVAGLLKAYPAELPNLPTVSPRQLNGNAPRDVKTTDGQARLDWKRSSDNAFAFLYSVNDYHEDPFEIVVGQNPQTDLRDQNAQINNTRVLSPNTTATFGFSYNRSRAALLPTKQYSNLLASAGYSIVPDIQFSSTPTTYSELFNIGPGGQFPRTRTQNDFHLYSQIAKTMGSHKLKAGWSSTRYQVNDLQNFNERGSLSFLSDFGRTPSQNFLFGTPSNFTIAIGNSYRGYRNWQHDFFIEDEYRLTPDFMVSIGARYELMTAPTEVNNLDKINFPTDKNNVAPRIGLAWNPNKGKTTIRASYGISYGTIPPPSYGVTRFNEPNIQIVSINSPDILTALNHGYNVPGRSASYSLSPTLVFPYSHIYTFGIERTLPGATRLRLSYTGSRSFHLLTQGAYNRARFVPGIPTTTATINDRRADPTHYGIYVIESDSIAYFDSAQVSVDKRLARGLTFRASYSFSKAIDLGGDFTNNATNSQNISEIGQASCEVCDYTSDHKGVALFDTPHAASFSYSYSFPAIPISNGWIGAVSRGWQLSGNTIFQSGTPLHIHTGSDGPGFGNVDGEAQDRPNILNPSILGKSVDNPDTSTQILNQAYFNTILPPGGRGNIGMNTFRKKGTNNTNMAFGRTFKLPGERSRTLQFRSEFINLFNRAQFDKPGNTLNSTATFGKITNTVNKGRQIQFSLRVSF